MSCGFLKQIIFIIWHSLRHQTWVQILPGSYPLTFVILIFFVYFFIFNSPWHQTWVQILPGSYPLTFLILIFFVYFFTFSSPWHQIWVQILPGSLPCLALSTHCQSSPPEQTEASLIREMEVGSVLLWDTFAFWLHTTQIHNIWLLLKWFWALQTWFFLSKALRSKETQ